MIGQLLAGAGPMPNAALAPLRAAFDEAKAALAQRAHGGGDAALGGAGLAAAAAAAAAAQAQAAKGLQHRQQLQQVMQ
jgi:hypothetical protein